MWSANLRSRSDSHRTFKGLLHAFFRQSLSNHLCTSEARSIQTIEMIKQHWRSRIKAQPHYMDTYPAPLTRQLDTTDKPHARWHTMGHAHEPSDGVVVCQSNSVDARRSCSIN